MNSIILFGGEGYIGKILSETLIKKKFNVTSYDNFIYQEQPFLPSKNLVRLKEDILDKKKVLTSLKNKDVAIILAGLVGDPITKKYPEYSIRVNETGIKLVIDSCFKKKIKRLIFISTCSNYGLIPENIKANEEYPLKPISLYAKSKVNIERYLLSLRKKNFSTSATILRFATAFGYSSRMRFDLTVNQFVKDMYLNNVITVYDQNTWRPYCHVKDFARLIIKILSSPKNKIHFEIFNAGGDENNFTKKMIAENILFYFPKGKINYLKNDVDPRNYKVSFEKLKNSINFVPKFNLQYGIEEILSKIKNNEFVLDNKNLYGNYLLRKNLII